MAVIDSKGFRRYTDEELDFNARSIVSQGFGLPSIPESFQPFSFIYFAFIFVRAILKIIDEIVEKVYYSIFPVTATGISLEFAASLTGKKIPALKAKTSLLFSATPGTFIDVGATAETETGLVFITTESGTVGVSGEISLQAEAAETGVAYNLPANAIIVLPIRIADSVTNPTPVINGREKENDVDFRERIRKSAIVTSSLAACEANVRNVPSVIDVAGYSNRGTVFDENGLAPGELRIVVEGGSDDEIVQALGEVLGAGTGTFGQFGGNYTDSQGNVYPVTFDRFINLLIFIKLTLTVDEFYDPGKETVIKDRIIQLFGGVDSTGNLWSGRKYTKELPEVRSWEIVAILKELSGSILSAEGEEIPGILSASALLGESAGQETELAVPLQLIERSLTDAAYITIEIL